MKRLLAFALTCVAMLSCSKLEQEDPADKFVGTYSVSVTQFVVWGSASGTLSDNGTFMITKESATKVRVSGYMSTTGEVTGSTLYLNGFNSSDSAGYINTTFSPATLAGNVLTFTASRSGQLKDNGIAYPYRSTDNFTAIKK